MDHKTFFSNLFPLGSHLCREPMPPMPELKRDMETLKKHGFNLVKLQEHWMVDEPLEGQCDFSRYEALIEHAAMLDMGVYLGLTCEQAPGWLYRKHPACRMVGRNGQTIIYEAQTTLPADGKPGPCYDHPGALADQNRFITRLVDCLGRYENLVIWNTWQEIAYWPMQGAGQPVCYCEHTLESFRCWLEAKYGDLDELNRAWNTRYGDWSLVGPDRGAYGQMALPHDVDWRYFMDNVQVANVLRQRAQAIKAADPLGRPVFAHKGGMVPGYGHDWTYARTQDFLGSSCYPAWNPFHAWDDGAPQRGSRPDRTTALKNEAVHGVAFTYDMVRSCNRAGAPLWAAEFQGGPVSTMMHKGRVPSPEDIRRWMLTAVSCGVTAIAFWVTRAEIMPSETNGFSLLDSEGDTTPRLTEAARIGAALNRHPDLFARPTWVGLNGVGSGSPVAILVNEWNGQLCSTVPPALDHLAYSTRGWHHLLWELGIPADFIEAGELDEKAAQYKAIIAPFPLSISEEIAEALARYTEQGGSLISEVAPGRLTEHNFANRGELSPALRTLFGVRHESLAIVREPGDETRWTPTERTWGEFLDPTVVEGAGPLAGTQTQANFYLETFAPLDSEPVLRWGEACAGVTRAVGKGRAWLLGTCLGHNATAYRSDDADALARALLASCGFEPLSAGKLLVRKRATAGKQAWFLTNPTGESITESLTVGGGRAADLLGEALEQLDGNVTLTVPALDVRVLIIEE